jgi:hypothetical protein
MKNINKQNLSKDIQRQKIMFGISLFAVIYLIYFGAQNEEWSYYCAIASAYIFTKTMKFLIKIYKNHKLLK